jgi:hypothetical protein
MKTAIFFLGLLVMIYFVYSNKLLAQEANNINYESLYNQLENLGLQNISAKIFDYTIERDVGKFYLKTGDIYLGKPIFGKEYAFVFSGIGEFNFKPPTRVEQEQLERFFETKELVKSFNALVIFVGDTMIKQLRNDLKFAANERTDKYNSELEDCLEYITDEDSKYIKYSIAKTILEGNLNDQFFAHIVEDGEDPFAFEVDPYQVEEIRFLRSLWINYKQSNSYEVINQFHKKQDYSSLMSLTDETKNNIDVIHYKLDGIIDDGLDFSCGTEMTFKAKKDNQKWLRLRLFHKSEIDSIFWANGDTVEHFKYEENSNLWIHCTTPFKKDSTYKLKIYYHGELIDRARINWFYIWSSISWYPKQNGKDKAIFDITFHTPERYTFVSVGEQKFYNEVEDDFIHSQWVTDKPIRNASFNIGVFKEFEVDEEGIPPATVLISEEGHLEMAHTLGQAGILSGSDMEKQVAADVANSLAFYQDTFGPCPAKKLYATEIPHHHGEAFPGLIHLSWTTFQQTDKWGRSEVFRGHEVAHQWWGIGVDFKTYHDQWLSEGFADYSGLWYMQTVLKDNEKFFNILGKWKTDILENRKFLVGSGQEAGPIWLGYRNVTSDTKEDFSIIVYKKGAWILHMLRNMMLDLRTMKEDRFRNMIKDYYTTYMNKSASTIDFQRVVEKHINKDMDWFFDQWVYGTGIPEYNFSWSSNLLKNGNYLVQCRVYQENVAKDFQMYVPIQVSFGDKGVARLRLLIDGNKTDFDLPEMPFKPEEITFNYLESVLCEVND